MSTCPNNDIHSIYLDNELPANFLAEYEEHLKSCPACQAELRKLKNARNLFQNDNDPVISHTSSQKELDESFARLQARLSYSKITGKTSKSSRPKHVQYLGYIATGVAAALVVAFVLPTKQVASIDTMAETASFQPMARTSFEQQLSNRSYLNPSLSTVNLNNFSESDNDGGIPVTSSTQNISTVSSTGLSSYELLGSNTPALNSDDNTNEGFSEITEGDLQRMNQEIQKMNFIFTFNSLYNSEDYYIGN